jgi:hypothetical protein
MRRRKFIAGKRRARSTPTSGRHGRRPSSLLWVRTKGPQGATPLWATLRPEHMQLMCAKTQLRS